MVQVKGEKLLAVTCMAIIVTGQRVEASLSRMQWEIQCAYSPQEYGQMDGKVAFQQQGAWRQSSWVSLGHKRGHIHVTI